MDLILRRIRLLCLKVLGSVCFHAAWLVRYTVNVRHPTHSTKACVKSHEESSNYTYKMGYLTCVYSFPLMVRLFHVLASACYFLAVFYEVICYVYIFILYFEIKTDNFDAA